MNNATKSRWSIHSAFSGMSHDTMYPIIILLAVGFVVRLFAHQIDFSFENDVRTFQIWGAMLFQDGFGAFFAQEGLTDYPPMYMYVLFLIGALRAAFDLDFLSPMLNFFTFLPAMLADLGLGFMIYYFAKKSGLKQSLALMLCAFWIFNPAIILISSIWGQVESVFLLFLLPSLWFLHDRKLLPAYILFGFAIMTKPQSLFLGPVYLYSAIDFYLQHKNAGLKTIFTSIAAGGLTMVVVSIPFGVIKTFRMLFAGMDMYNFATVNAFNLWGLLGKNWVPLETPFLGLTFGTWGIIIALAIIIGAMLVLYFDDIKNNRHNFFLIVAAIFILIFVFSVKMHERYLFPGLLFLVVYMIKNRNWKIAGLYVVFSVTFFINCIEILRWLRGGFQLSVIEMSTPIISAVNVLFSIIFSWVMFKCLNKNESKKQ